MNDDSTWIQALKAGDEAAFAALIDQYHAALIRAALIYVHDSAVAEEVVQETWIGVLKGIHRFEGRSSLKTWIFSILINRAKSVAQREGRYEPLILDDEPSVPPERFLPDSHKYAGHWQTFPRSWEEIPEERLLSLEIQTVLRQVIDRLPAHQRAVIVLHDIDGLSTKDVCNILQISETNQRVLLHRARSRVRAALEAFLEN